MPDKEPFSMIISKADDSYTFTLSFGANDPLDSLPFIIIPRTTELWLSVYGMIGKFMAESYNYIRETNFKKMSQSDIDFMDLYGLNDKIRQNNFDEYFANLIYVEICDSIPTVDKETTDKNGNKSIKKIKTIKAPLLSIATMSKIEHAFETTIIYKDDLKSLNEWHKSYKPTKSLVESLYPLSYSYFNTNKNVINSTYNILSWCKGLYDNSAPNGILIDVAKCTGGQGKNISQNALKKFLDSINYSHADSNFPNNNNSFTSDVWAMNSLVVVQDAKFNNLNYELINSIVDKENYTINKKGIQEYCARSHANIYTGTNFFPTDANDRRWLIRNLDSNKVAQDFLGMHGLPDKIEKFKDYLSECWANVIYYAKDYDIAYLNDKRDFSATDDADYVEYIREACEAYSSTTVSISMIWRNFKGAHENIYTEAMKFSFTNTIKNIAKHNNIKKNIHHGYNGNIDWSAIITDDFKVVDELSSVDNTDVYDKLNVLITDVKATETTTETKADVAPEPENNNNNNIVPENNNNNIAPETNRVIEQPVRRIIRRAIALEQSTDEPKYGKISQERRKEYLEFLKKF